PFLLTYFVTGVPCRALIDGAPTPTAIILRHVRSDLHLPHFLHEFLRVICFVGGQRHTIVAIQPLGHHHRRIPFRRSIALQPFRIHHTNPLRFSISTLPQ